MHESVGSVPILGNQVMFFKECQENAKQSLNVA